MRLDLEDRLSAEVPIGHPVMAWLVRHVGFCHTAFVKGADGRTPWERVRGRVYGQRLYHFGEKVHWKLPEKGPRARPRGNADEKWQPGIYLGNEYEASSYIVSLGEVTVSSNAVMRYPDVERWSRDGVQAVAAFPWTTRDNREPPMALGEQRQAAPPVVTEEPKALRRLRINPADVERFGTTPGCTQCDNIARWGKPRAGTTHNDTCRARMSAELQKTPEGRMRLEAHEERLNSRMARVIEEADAERRADEDRPALEHPGPADAMADVPPDVPREAGGADLPVDDDLFGREGEGPDTIDADDHEISEDGHGMDLGYLEEMAELAIFNCLAVDSRAFRRERKKAYRRVISELYSPPRVTEMLSALPNAALVPGYALDLTVIDPADDEPWDFSRKVKQDRARRLLDRQRPMLVVLSPECKTFSTWN